MAPGGGCALGTLCLVTLNSWAMPLRTILLAQLVRRLRGNSATMTHQQLLLAREFVAPPRFPFTLVTGPVYSDVDISESSFRARDGESVGVRIYQPTLPGASASVPRPDVLPCVVFFHGGGWVLGRPRGYDPLCSFIAHEAGVVVVSVDYRLAPEHRAPQAVLDAIDAVRWVTRSADALGVRAANLGVAGDSAGGNLSAVVTQVIRDEGGADIGHQSLIYPATDATMTHPSVTEHAYGAILNRAHMDTFMGYYLGDDANALDPRDPRLSPLYAADLARLPPALVQTAQLDPLRDEGIAYAKGLIAAGVPVRATNYSNTPHGFMSFPGATRAGRPARQELANWIAHYAR